MIFFYIVIGLVQGLTEFLPISSSGHIVLVASFFCVSYDILLLSVVAHLGTLVSVIIVFRKRLWEMIKNPFSKEVYLLLVATIPTIILVLLFGDFVDSVFNSDFIVFGFLITAVLLAFVDKKKCTNRDIGYKKAAIMGLAQGLAILPGLSRSGTTVAAGVYSGIEKQRATDFSFLMSIPVIIGSGIMELKNVAIVEMAEVLPLTITFFVSIIAGILSIKIMLCLIKKSKLYYFSIYLLILSLIIILL